MYRPSYEEAKQFAQAGQEQYRVVPVMREILSDIATPIQVLRKLMRISRHCYLLESVEDSRRWGRYTFLGFDPKLEIVCRDGELKIRSGTTIGTKTDHPGIFIRNVLKENRSPKIGYMPPFTGGLAGYFSYDYIRYAEPKLRLEAEDQEHFNDVDLMLFDKVIAFDNLRQKIIVIANARLDEIETTYHRAVLDIEEMISVIRDGLPAEPKPGVLKSEFRNLFGKEEFCGMVEKAKEYIREGDIFQVVLSNRTEADFEGSLLDTYRILRTVNPSPYMFYFSGQDVEIAGASPETLVKLQDGVLHTFPLAGTRPRGRTEQEDEALEKELLSDPKELAEHNMLVDLGRNDIGRLSRFGSVEVEKYLCVERFSHVMHLGSTVRGEIREDKDSVDAIDCVLPAGTLSGAPKIRACEIISELENNKRGIYGGAIGYLDFTGNLDTCIAIRIAFSKNGKVFVRSGAGIVADSVPEKEYQECINKAAAVTEALQKAQELGGRRGNKTAETENGPAAGTVMTDTAAGRNGRKG